jgi:hypothetical protein
MTVYIVSYIDDNGEPTVTAFDNIENATICRDSFETMYGNACLDEVPVYSKFIVY